VTAVRDALDLTSLGPGAPELGELLSELLGADGRGVEHIAVLRPLKPPHVYRLELVPGEAPWRSVVVKRLGSAVVAHRTRLAAERWLPALGLADGCARLLGVAAEARGDVVWQVYEDVGDETVAARRDPDRVAAAVALIARLHTRAAGHAVLPDVRRYCPDFGIGFLTANLRDAIAALEAVQTSGIKPSEAHAGVAGRLLSRLRGLLPDVDRRAAVFADAAGPETLLHGDLWTTNAVVVSTAAGLRACLVDWDHVGVGPFAYDLSTLLFRFPLVERAGVLDAYRRAVAPAGWSLPPAAELNLICETAELARCANRVIWPALALVRENAAWGYPELAEVERWFEALDGGQYDLQKLSC
jgi:Phosphotransferase enzyme family